MKKVIHYFLVSVMLFFILPNILKGQDGLDDLRNYTNNQFNGKYLGGLRASNPQYPKYQGKIDVIVNNKKEFLNLINSKRTYYGIYISDGAVIDLTDQNTLYVKTGVKIVSGRGNNKSSGALILTKKDGIHPLFECGSFVTFYGIRLQGSDNNIYAGKKFIGQGSDFKNKYTVQASTGIQSKYEDLIVENCELSGWTHSAIIIKGAKASGVFRYNYIHHNRRHGLGYGITVDGGNATILANVFDYNRHDIASTGIANSAYKATNNLFLANGTSHSVDVHGGRDRKDNTNLAGRRFDVSNNTFILPGKRQAFVIRGIPSEQAIFDDNKIVIKGNNSVKSRAISMGRESKPSITQFVIQKNAKGKLITRNNNIQ